MVEKTGTSEAKTAYGKKLDTPLTYDYKWTEYADGPELVAAKDEMTLDEQVKQRNIDRMANARQKALTARLEAAGITKPTAANDDQVRLRDMFKTLMTAKDKTTGQPLYTEEQARAFASQACGGIEWAE